MFQIYLAHEFYFFRTTEMEFKEHFHVAPQLSLTEPGHTISLGEVQGNAVFVPSGYPHTNTCDAPISTYLLNPACPPARALARTNRKICAFEPDDEVVELLTRFTFQADQSELLQRALDSLLTSLLGTVPEPEPLDRRIREAIDLMDELEEKRISAGQLAEEIALSESWFLRLFKDEMKMTVRKYLLWIRTTEAAQLVLRGQTATYAAHAAGFTDSAHFSKAFKQMFGSTLTTVFGPRAGSEFFVCE